MGKKTAKPPHVDAVVSQSDADAFTLFVREWQHKLNLSDWRIHRSAKPASKANMAEVNRMDLGARLATYAIGQDFGSITVNGQSVEETACHEVLHVFLAELIAFCKEDSSEEDIQSAEHRVINVLVGLLVPQS